MTTADRLLNLLSLLQTGREWSGSTLADRLHISARTVRRDVDRLREMGYCIRATMGPEGGYRLAAGQALPPILFDDDQAVAVAIALRAATSLGAGIEDAAVRALNTIRQVMPSPLRHRLDAIEFTTIGRAGDGPSVTAPLDVLRALTQRISDRQTLYFDYVPRAGSDAAQAPASRRAEPHHLTQSRSRWYLVAWDLDRQDWRIFSADRIRPSSKPGLRFAHRTAPGGDFAAFVSARFKGSDGPEWPCVGTVLIQLPAEKVLPFVGDGQVTAVDAESCLLKMGSWSWHALAAVFGQFNAPMNVVEPQELRESFNALAQRYTQAAHAERNSKPE
ncbi:helix-turn-helix transcriptional regulator [Roseateles sp. BYS87W]|uniref:Helix-turn-helix transcriptional regulator n=1 Tax=Pelomonas baiyunensis TaxID=3299026 RepID=A0ABW7H2F0_9BURK